MIEPAESSAARAMHEIAHGELLARGDPELIWGWGSPAGRLRAARRAQLIAAGAGLEPGKRVLEIGCGTGMFTQMFAATGARIVAVDISAPLIARAQGRRLPADQVRFLVKRFEDCDVDGPFDAVIGSSILHHLDLTAALGKIHELLRPGGRMSFAEPNMMNPQILVQKNVPIVKRWLGDSPDETAFVRWPLGKLLARCGFGLIEITPFDWLHPRTPRPLLGLVGGAGKMLERLPLLRELSGSLLIRCAKR
ncbi:MAG: class I SAM-dependent methyltransferase [Planctomycetota bacterium]